MSAKDALAMLDYSTRLSLFVEGIKMQQIAEFNSVLNQADKDFRLMIQRLKYEKLNQMTKVQLNALLASLRKSQSKIYGGYAERLIQRLKEFMKVQAEVCAIVFATAHIRQTRPDAPIFSAKAAYAYIERVQSESTFVPVFGMAFMPGKIDTFWSRIINAPIPANGVLLVPFVGAFAKSATSSIENEVRKAYANGLTVSETLEAVSPSRVATSQMNRTRNQAASVIDTTFAHVDQMLVQAVASAINEFYQWVSVMDNATTAICTSRNGKVYRYGQGPVPPAHYGCRSTTIPLASLLDDFKPPTLYTWLRDQPRSVIVSLVGSRITDALESGELNSKTFSLAMIRKPLEIGNLKSKIEIILKPRFDESEI